MKSSLGTQLRHLVELLDTAVQAGYVSAGLTMSPRYTPVVRALIEREPSTIGQIASQAGISQPAVTQTIALMLKDRLVSASKGPGDARQRLIRLTRRGRALVPELQACWAATQQAADTLDGELRMPLSEILAEAIAALEVHPFEQRIALARNSISGSREIK